MQVHTVIVLHALQAWSTQIKYGTPTHVFNLQMYRYCVGNLHTVVSDLEVLGRQADHSRSVPIVYASFRLQQWLQPGVELGDYKQLETIHSKPSDTNISNVTLDL